MYKIELLYDRGRMGELEIGLVLSECNDLLSLSL